MDPPPFYKLFHTIPPKIQKSGKQIALWLHQPLYGTKQGAHHWYQELKWILIGLGFGVSQADEAVFYRVENDKFTILAVATDDFTIIADSPESSVCTKEEMNKFFELVDLGPISWLLGVSAACEPKKRTILLSQKSYIKQILNRFRLSNAKPISTLMEPRINLAPDSPSVLPTLLSNPEKSMYRKMIGSLMYLSTMMCPEITYAVSTLSKYLDSPHSTHLEAIKQIFQYLINTRHLQLIIGSNCLTNMDSTSRILGFSDADWASQLHHHSISEFTFFVGVGAVSWSTKCYGSIHLLYICFTYCFTLFHFLSTPVSSCASLFTYILHLLYQRLHTSLHHHVQP